MTFLRVLIVILGLAFAGMIGWAFTVGDFMEEFRQVTAFAWGKVSLADLYLGFFLFAIIILAFEQIWIGLPVVILMFLLGNTIPALWLALRLPKVIRKMRGVA